jgi:hypothetical protein
MPRTPRRKGTPKDGIELLDWDRYRRESGSEDIYVAKMSGIVTDEGALRRQIVDRRGGVPSLSSKAVWASGDVRGGSFCVTA